MKSVIVSSNGSVLAYLGNIVINELHSLATILPINKPISLEQIVGKDIANFKLFLVHAKNESELSYDDINWALSNGAKVVVYCEDLPSWHGVYPKNLFKSQVVLSNRMAVIEELIMIASKETSDKTKSRVA